MKRRLLAALLALCMVVGMVPASVMAAEPEPASEKTTAAGASPADAPVNPDPADPPVNPDPADAPVNPDPVDPPVNPDPVDSPVNPDPVDPPVNPDPVDPPVNPDPADPLLEGAPAAGAEITVSQSIPAEAVTGEAIPVVFSVTNPGTADVSDVLRIDFAGTNMGWKLYMTFDQDVEYTPEFVEGDYSENIAAYLVTLNVPAGQTVTLNANIYASQAGAYSLNTGFAGSEPVNHTLTVTGETVAPVVRPSAKDLPATVTVGQEFDFTLFFRNDTCANANMKTVYMDFLGTNTGSALKVNGKNSNRELTREEDAAGLRAYSITFDLTPFMPMIIPVRAVAAEPGTYQFKLTCGDVESEIYTLVVEEASVPQDQPFSIGTQGYPDLQSAVSAAKDGDTILMNQDVTAAQTYIEDHGETRNLTLDLGGHVLTWDRQPDVSNFLSISGGSVTIANGTLEPSITNDYGAVISVFDGELSLKNIRLNQVGGTTAGVVIYGNSSLSVDKDSVICGSDAIRLYTRDDSVTTAEIAGTVCTAEHGDAIFSFTQSGSTGSQIHFAPTAVIDGPVSTQSHDQVLVDNGSRFRTDPFRYLNDQQVAVTDSDGFYVVKDRNDASFTHNLEITTTLPQTCATGKMCQFDVTFRNLGDTVYKDRIAMDLFYSAGDLFDMYFNLDCHLQWEQSENGYVFYPQLAPGSVTTIHCKTSSADPGTLTLNFRSGTEKPQRFRVAFEGERIIPSYEITVDAPTQASAGMTFRITATMKNPSEVLAKGQLALCMLNASADKPFEMNAGNNRLTPHYNADGVRDGGSVWYRLEPFAATTISYLVTIPNPGDYQFQLSTRNQQTEPFTVTVAESLPADPSACEARIGSIGFRTLQEALDNAKPGDTITVMKDIVSSPLSCRDTDLRLNLMGHTLTLRDTVKPHAVGIDVMHSSLDIDNGRILGECSDSMDAINLENSVMNLRNTRVETFGKGNGEIFSPAAAVFIANGSRLHVDADSVLYADTGIASHSSYGSPSNVIFEGQIHHQRFVDSVSNWAGALNITFTDTAVVDGVMHLTNESTVTIQGGKFMGDPFAYLADNQIAVRGADGYYTVKAMTPPSENDLIVVQQSIPADGVTGEALPVSFTIINNTDADVEDTFNFNFRHKVQNYGAENLALVMEEGIIANPQYSSSGVSGYKSWVKVPAHGQITLKGTLYASTPGTYKFISTFQNNYTLPSKLEITGEQIHSDVTITPVSPQASVPAGTMGHMTLTVKNSSAVRSRVNLEVAVQGPGNGKNLHLRYDRLYPTKEMEPDSPDAFHLYITSDPFTNETYDISFLATEPGTYTLSYQDAATGNTLTQTVEVTPYVEPDPAQCEAKVGNLYFRTITEAIAALGSGDTLTLLKDVTVDSAFSLEFQNLDTWGSLATRFAAVMDLNRHSLLIRPDKEVYVGMTITEENVTIRNGTIRWASASVEPDNYLLYNSDSNLNLENVTIGNDEFLPGTRGIWCMDNSVLNIDAASVVRGNPALQIDSFYEGNDAPPVSVTLNGTLETGSPTHQADVLWFFNPSAGSSLNIGASAVIKGQLSCVRSLQQHDVANGARFTEDAVYLLHVGQNFAKGADGLWEVVTKKNETTVQPLPQEIPQEDHDVVQQVAQNVQTVIPPQEPTPEDKAAAEAQGATDVKVDTYLEVAVKEYQNTPEAKTLVMDIEPMAQVKATKGNEEIKIGDPKPIEEQHPVEVLIPLPDDFAAEGEIIYLTHTKDDGTAYEYELPVQKDEAGGLFIQFCNMNGFSTFAVTKIKPEPKLDITQQVSGSSITFQVTNTGTADYTGELEIYVSSDAADGELTLTFPENAGAVKTGYGYQIPIAVPAENGVVTLTAAAEANTPGTYRIASNANGIHCLETVLEISGKVLPKLLGANVIAGNNLDMMFAIPGEGYDWTGCVAKIVRTYSDGRPASEEAYPFDQWNALGKNYTITYKGLAAKEMADTLTVTVYNAQDEALTEPWVDSMRSYAMRTLRSETITALEKTVMVDMLNYGTAAQKHFQYGTNDLADSQLTAEDKSFASTQKPLVNNLNPGNEFAGSNLVVKSNLQFLLAFNGLTEDMKAVVSFENHYGKQIERTIPGTQFGTAGACKTIVITDLVIADARQEITVRIYKADGSLYTECHESIEANLARANSIDEVYQMVIRFADSAYEYLNSKVK